MSSQEVSPEARAAAREKYGVAPNEMVKNSSLSALGWIAVLGFALAVIGIIVTVSVEDIVFLTVGPSIVNAGIAGGFFALVGYLVTKAIISSRNS